MIRFILASILFTTLFAASTTTTQALPTEKKSNNAETVLVAPDEAGVQLVLVGAVVEEADQTPLEGIEVRLVEMETQEEIKISTEESGNFYFNLEMDKKYELHAVNEFGIVMETKTISTINKVDPEVMHAIIVASEESLKKDN